MLYLNFTCEVNTEFRTSTPRRCIRKSLFQLVSLRALFAKQFFPIKIASSLLILKNLQAPRNDTNRHVTIYRPRNTWGMALMASIMLIVFASIAVLGVTTFIVSKLSSMEANRIASGCVNLAEGGVHQAVYNFRFHDLSANGYFSLGRTNVDANNYLVLGGTAGDLLMVNTVTVVLSPNEKDLINLSIKNATNSKTITIDRMIVSWNNAMNLTQIRINNSNVWSGNLTSPANADITNFTLDSTPTIYSIDRLRFNAKMTGATITVQFVMTDGATKTLTVYPASANYNFTVKSTGKTTGFNIYRTIQADYNASTARIINYNEINTEITP